MARNTLQPDTPERKKLYIPISHAILIGIVLLLIAPASNVFKKWQEDQEKRKTASIELIAKGAAQNLTEETAAQIKSMGHEIADLKAKAASASTNTTLAHAVEESNNELTTRIDALATRLDGLEDGLSKLNGRILALAEERTKASQ